MLEPPIATSSPLLKAQWGRRKSKNNRRSISLLDVSVIQTPDIISQKSESCETLASVCKDSGYVRSEGSWLEEDESKESKDLSEELRFKDVLISELQESNRGLRMRCADAENKIWRLRVKCEEHCRCCQVVKDAEPQEDEVFSDSNDHFAFPDPCLATSRRHSLAVSETNAGDEGYNDFRVPMPSNNVTAHRLRGPLYDKPFVRSLSSGMIPMQKSRAKTHKGQMDHRLTSESLSLSKVHWWQRDLFPQAKECSKDMLQSDPNDRQKFNEPFKAISDESDNSNRSHDFSAILASDALMVSRLVRQYEEECAENGCDQKLDVYSHPSPTGFVNGSGARRDIALRSPKILSLEQTVDSSCESDLSFSFPSFTLPAKKQGRVLMPDTFDGTQQHCQPQAPNNMRISGNSEDAMTRVSSLEPGSCHISSQPDVNINKCFAISPNGNSLHTQLHCGCSHHPSQIIIVPTGCCCRLMDNSSACTQSCSLPNRNKKCDQQCHPSSSHSPSILDSSSAEHLPLFVPKSKSTSLLKREPSVNSNLQIIPEHIPTHELETCTDNCTCATSCSGCLTVPLSRRLDAKARMVDEIKERMNKLASSGRAETDCLSFKPWPPPHFAEMSPLMRCLAETSDYVRQMAMVFEKVNSSVHRISTTNHPNSPV